MFGHGRNDLLLCNSPASHGHPSIRTSEFIIDSAVRRRLAISRLTIEGVHMVMERNSILYSFKNLVIDWKPRDLVVT